MTIDSYLRIKTILDIDFNSMNKMLKIKSEVYTLVHFV